MDVVFRNRKSIRLGKRKRRAEQGDDGSDGDAEDDAEDEAGNDTEPRPSIGLNNNASVRSKPSRKKRVP